MLRQALAICVCLPLAGCVFGSRRAGPEGLSRYDTDLRSIARQEQFDRALELTEEGKDDAGDDLLRILHRATLLRYDGQYEESNLLLQEAAREIDDRYTKSISRAALSMLTNDRALAYNPPPFERMMVHYYGALNYLSLDDPEEAAVEARLLSALLVADAEDRLDARDDRLRRSLHYFAGVVFEAAGEWNAADVAYRNAWEGWDRAPGAPVSDVERTTSDVEPTVGPSRKDRLNRGRSSSIEVLTPAFIARDRAPAPDSGEVVLLLETGFVAHRVERGAAVPIFKNDASNMEDGSDADRYDAGLCVAARTLGSSAVIDSDECSEPTGKSVFILTIAWPEIRRTREPIRGARLVVRSDSVQRVPTAMTIDLSSAAMSELEARIGGILAKSIVRATGKYLVVEAIEEELEEEDETAGYLFGLFGNAAAVASERADIRSWHMLPGAIRIARVSLPSGVHSIDLELDSLGYAEPLRMGLGSVTVRPGSITVLPVRSWP